MVTMNRNTQKHTFWVAAIATLAISLVTTAAKADTRTFELSFPRNSIYTVVSNGIVRGNTHDHYLSAQAGQAISIALTSPENNAVFSLLYQQNGTWREQIYSQKAWFGQLPPSDGNRYIISVGSTRGNTSYDLFVGISLPNF